MNVEKVELLDKLKVIAERASEHEKGYISEFLAVIFDRSEYIPAELFEYLYKSEFLEKVSAACINKCTALLEQDNAIGWFMIVESAFGLHEPELYCDVVFRAYENNLSPDSVGELLECCSSNKDFASQVDSLLARTEECSSVTEPNASDQSQNNDLLLENKNLKAKYENLYAEFLEIKKKDLENEHKLEAFYRASKRESLKYRLLEGKIRQLTSQNTMLKSINDTLSTENIELEKQLDRASESTLARDEHIGELEAKLSDLEQASLSFNRQLQEKIATIADLREEVAHMEAEAEEPDEDEVLRDEYAEDGQVTPIPNKFEEFMAKNKLFARLFAGSYAKKFNEKPVQEQENLVFLKMMHLHFDKGMVRQVKDAMGRNNLFSRLDIYNFVSSRPTADELAEYCNSII